MGQSEINGLPPKVNLLGIGISRVTYNSAVDAIIGAAKEKRSFGVTALAVHGVMEGFKDPRLAEQINSLHIVTPDGQPVRWAINLLGAKEIKERVYGPNLMLKVCEQASMEKIPIFLFGSTEQVLGQLVKNLKFRFPQLQIAGIQADRFREATIEEDAKDRETIHQSGATIVFVGRGCPRQERWVASHLGTVNAALIAVGAAFDFHAGLLPQAPQILQRFGLEWLFRLFHEPKRLWKRYLFLNPSFMINFMLQLSKLRRF